MPLQQGMGDNNPTRVVGENHNDITGTLSCCAGEISSMPLMYEAGCHSHGQPTFLQLPSNFHFMECEAQIESPAGTLMVDYLKFGFHEGYKGPVPSLATGNYPAALRHQCNVVLYIMA